MTCLGEPAIKFILHLLNRPSSQPSNQQPNKRVNQRLNQRLGQRSSQTRDIRLLASCCFSLLLSLPLLSSADTYKAPRGPDGVHPDLNGIWQALNSAHFNLEGHVAAASVEVREGPHGSVPSQATLAMGSLAAVPPGLGVVVGGKIPYLKGAADKRATNQANWAKLDPEVKCYLPGIPRATYMPYPFQILQGKNSVFMAYQYAGRNPRGLYG